MKVSASPTWFTVFAVTVVLASFVHVGLAGTVNVPNASFESPSAPFPTPNFDSWQKTPKPAWYIEDGIVFYWTQLTGAFQNTLAGSFDHIDNCDGLQAIWLFAVPEVGLFQDFDSVDWSDPSPTHDFNAAYEAGKSYQLTVGILVGGMGSGGGIKPGATVDLILYYRDATSNRVPVAVTTITNSLSVFSNSTHLIDFAVDVPTVQPGDAWAGQHIGIMLLSTVTTGLEGGYWDLDHVRLSSMLSPTLSNTALTSSQFQFTVNSEPGAALEILTSTNTALPKTNWTRLGALTNTTGTIPFVDTNAIFDQRFYQARQLP